MTVLWEEEKVGRDSHEDWEDIRERLREEAENSKEEEKERLALEKAASDPKLDVSVEGLNSAMNRVTL